MKTRIKICCISSKEEAKMAVDYGAAALGLVSKMPSGPGVINDKLIREISAVCPPSISTFLLTSETSTEKILSHHEKTFTTTIQFVDKIETAIYSELRQKLCGIKLVQVIHVIDQNSVDEALEYSDYADALLLDSGNPNLEVKVLGGTGKTHNWKLSREIVRQSRIPVFLAGGLNSENVIRAIEEVNPFGVDLCSGVRTNGKLDERKLDQFFNTLDK